MRYRYKVGLSWTDPVGVVTEFDPALVKSFMIYSDYEGSFLPMIVLNMKIRVDIYDKIILNKDKGFFLFTLKKYKDSDPNYVMEESYVGVQCSYYTLDDINYREKIVENASDKEDYHRVVNIGLIREDLLTQNRCSANTVINTSLMGIISSQTKVKRLLTEYIGKSYSGIIPPISKVSELLNFLEDQIGPFYPTPYRFFIDNDRTYLISSSGQPIYAKGDKQFAVSIEILDPTDDRVRNDGATMDISGNICNVLVSAERTRFQIDSIEGSKTNKYTHIGYDTSVGNVDVNLMTRKELIGLNKFSYSPAKFLNHDKFTAELNNKSLTIMLDECDNSIFTINRKFIIKNIEKYKQYDGEYLLVKKIEGFIQEGEVYKSIATVVFKKIPR
jgi:hypothetical protein